MMAFSEFEKMISNCLGKSLLSHEMHRTGLTDLRTPVYTIGCISPGVHVRRVFHLFPNEINHCQMESISE